MTSMELGRAYIEAVDRRDADALARLLSPSCRATSPTEIPTRAEHFHRELFQSSVRLRLRLRGLTEGATESGHLMVVAWCDFKWTMRGIGTVTCPGTVVMQLSGSCISSIEMLYGSLHVQSLRQEELIQRRNQEPRSSGDAMEDRAYTLVRAAVDAVDEAAQPPKGDGQRIKRDISAYQGLLDRPAGELEVQRFLEAHLYFWGHELRLGTRDIPLFSQVRLGTEFVCDFVFYDLGSTGMEWNLVEIEAPGGRLFKKDGDFSQGLNHAIAQVERWQHWVNSNQAAADQLMPGVMLPLGFVFMGRRSELDDDQHREHLWWFNSQNRSRVVVHTLDHFLDAAISASHGHVIASPRKARTGIQLRDQLPAQVRAWAHGPVGDRAEFLRDRIAGRHVSAD